jgi:hypothetical protein
MPSAGMLHRVALVRTDVSEELSASFIRVTRIGELGTTLAATSNRRKLRRNTKLVFQRPTVACLENVNCICRLTSLFQDFVSCLHGAEPLFKSCQLFSYSRMSQHSMNAEYSFQCS